MSKLILIQCSGSKVEGGKLLPDNDIFSFDFSETRAKLEKLKDLKIDKTKLMPAYLRYGAFQTGNSGGRLYTNMDWNHLLLKVAQNKLDVVIVSAFYGLIRYDTHISDYDLDMSKSVRLWLLNNTLGKALKKYIIDKEFSAVYSFLSTNYQEALGDFLPGKNILYENHWIKYDRGANVAKKLINPFLSGAHD
jgi:hypothetical protein